MGKFDRTCVVCGGHYDYCTNCDQFANYPAFMAMYCSQECVDLFDILTSYTGQSISKKEARKRLQNISGEKTKALKRSMAEAYKQIMLKSADEIATEEEEEKKETPEIPDNVIKKAVYDATRESGKNIPRSIAYKNKKH